MTWRRLTQIELLEQNHFDNSSWINDIHNHATDHALCGKDCETAQQRYESGDHHSCVSWYCRTALQLKAGMQLAEGLD